MGAGIKVLVALVFIIGAFLIGKYLTEEKCGDTIKKLERDVFQLKKEDKQLTDSVRVFIRLIDSAKTNSQYRDTTKGKIK